VIALALSRGKILRMSEALPNSEPRLAMARLARWEEADRSFDIEFWQRLGDDAIFAAAGKWLSSHTSSKEEMPASLHFKELLKKLNEHQVKYLVVGPYAVMKYTEPRYTKDFDIWVEPVPANARSVFEALVEFGAPMDEVTVEDFANRELVFQIGIEPVRIDIMMGIKGVEFSDAWPQRVETKLEDISMTLISKEHLLIAKRAAGRPQDLIDVDQLTLSQGLTES
jgi:hypothetical protein